MVTLYHFYDTAVNLASFKKKGFYSLFLSGYKPPIPSFSKELLANRPAVQSPLSNTDMLQKCHTQPKAKAAETIIMTEIINYNIEVNGWHLFLDNEACNVKLVT